MVLISLPVVRSKVLQSSLVFLLELCISSCRCLLEFLGKVYAMLWVHCGIEKYFARKRAKRGMDQSSTYAEWHTYAQVWDKNVMTAAQCTLHDHKFLNIRYLTASINEFSDIFNEMETPRSSTLSLEPKTGHYMMDLVRTHLIRSRGGLLRAELYESFKCRSPPVVMEYMDHVEKGIQSIVEDKNLTWNERYHFFEQAQKIHGNTALFLHGGLTLGLTHIGVVKALCDTDTLPNVICGTNTGSIVAALLCTSTSRKKPVSEIFKKINFSMYKNRPVTGALSRKIHRFLTQGSLLDTSVMLDFLRENLGDVTFEEAYRDTGRVLNIVARREDSSSCIWHMNYLTAPHVLIYSACAVACAMRGVFPSTQLYAKRTPSASSDHEITHPSVCIVPYYPCSLGWVPTHNEIDNPNINPAALFNRVRELFNISTFIVSHASPFEIPSLMRYELRKGLFWVILRTITGEITRALRWLHRKRLLGPYGSTLIRCIAPLPLEGNVNIFPCKNVKDILTTLSNPTPCIMKHYEHLGEIHTWPFVSYIQRLMQAEKAIQRALEHVWNEQEEQSRRS